MKEWRQLVVSTKASILEAVAAIDRAAHQVALVADELGRLVGMVTDGDVRRALLKGLDLKAPVSAIMKHDCKYVFAETAPEEIYATMLQLGLRHMPVINRDGTILGLSTIEDFLRVAKVDNSVFIMAGGLGSRLHPLTEDTPKPMLRLGEKPLLEIVIENFIRSGFHDFFLAVNYRSEIIKEYFGDGRKWGVSIKYLEEKIKLGTAGALNLLQDRPRDAFIVINGDVLTKVNFQTLLEYHSVLQNCATVCTREYDHQIPYGVVEVERCSVRNIREKPCQKYFVNAGVYVLSPESLDFIPPDSPINMTELLENLLEAGRKVGSFPISEYWIDIGQPSDFERASLEYEKFFVEDRDYLAAASPIGREQGFGAHKER